MWLCARTICTSLHSHALFYVRASITWLAIPRMMWWIQTHVHFSSSSTLLSNHTTLCIAHQSQHPVSYNLFNFVSSYYEWQHTRKSRWQLVVWNLSFPYLLHDLYACFLDSYSDDKLNRDNAKGLNSSRSFWRWVLFFAHTLANYDTLINHFIICF